MGISLERPKFWVEFSLGLKYATWSETGSRDPNDWPRIQCVLGFHASQSRRHHWYCDADAIFIGLYTRQTVAWMTARWLTAIGAVITSILFVFAAFGGSTELWILAVVALEVALAWLFFWLLGRADSRAYFNAPRKA